MKQLIVLLIFISGVGNNIDGMDESDASNNEHDMALLNKVEHSKSKRKLRALLEKGANVNAKNKLGETALMIALDRKYGRKK